MWNIKISSGQIALLCAVISVAGVVLLYFYSLLLQPTNTKIGDILVIPVGKYISVTGVAESIELDVSYSKINLCDPLDSSCISAKFSNDVILSIYSIDEGDTLTVKGIVSEYFNNKYIEVKNEGDITKIS